MKHPSRNNQQTLGQSVQDVHAQGKQKSTKKEPLHNKAKFPAKQIPSSKDSGIDTGSSNNSPDKVKVKASNYDHKMELKGDVLEGGLDNRSKLSKA